MKSIKNDGSIKKYIVFIIIMIVIIIGLICYILNDKKNKIIINSDFIYVLDSREIEIEDNYIFKDYDDFYSTFNSNVLKENDFINNNYVIIKLNYDFCSESDLTPTSYNINNNKINVVVKYKRHCGLCPPINKYYLLKVDKNIIDVKVNVNYKAINNPHCNPDIAKKPIIYLYPKEDTLVSVKLNNSKYLTTTYPKYNDGWNVLASPNGNLKDLKTGKNYYGLYWEGNNHNAYVHEDGFVIEGSKTTQFLEEKLSLLGLNEKEANEFIIYWLPKMESNKYNYIRFETIDEIKSYMKLDVNPKPDTIIRVMMDFKPLDNKITVKEQKLEKKERNGFTLVEWGGSEIK